MSTPSTKFKQTSIATEGDSGELVGMVWTWDKWKVIMMYRHGQGAGLRYEKAQYIVVLKHSTIIDHTLNLPKLYVQHRIMAIMLVMWLTNRLSQVCGGEPADMDIHWRQLVRDLIGCDDIDEETVVFVEPDCVRRVYRQMQELKREHSV